MEEMCGGKVWDSFMGEKTIEGKRFFVISFGAFGCDQSKSGNVAGFAGERKVVTVAGMHAREGSRKYYKWFKLTAIESNQ